MNSKEGKKSRQMLPEELKNMPVPISGHATETQLNTLLPYLALGFRPVRTSGQGTSKCGLNALFKSFVAAQRVLEIPNCHKAEDLNYRAFEEIFGNGKGEDYLAKVDEAYECLHSGAGLMPGDRREFTQTRDLNVEQIRLVLEIMNEWMGTTFALGVITLGFRGRLDRRTNKFDYNYVRPTSLNILHHAHNNPVLWIINDGDSVRRKAHGEKGEVGAHWEGFATSTDEDMPADEEGRQKIVFDWGLSKKILEVEGSVWWTNDYEEGITAANKPFEVQAGHFLRIAAFPKGGAKPWKGHKYMKLSDSTADIPTEGYVAETKLVLIKLDDSVRERESRQREKEGVATHSQEATKSKTNTRNISRKVFRVNDQNEDTYPFDIFRVVQYTDKIGRVPDRDSGRQGLDSPKPIPQLGEFVRDTRERRSDGREAKVVDIKGESIRTELRRLQRLERPWGLPEQLPLAEDYDAEIEAEAESKEESSSKPGKTFSTDNTMQNIRAKCKILKIKSTGPGRTKAVVVNELNRYFENEAKQKQKQNLTKSKSPLRETKKSRGVYLPMYRLKRSLPAFFSGGNVNFDNGEIVYGYGRDGEKIYVTDYEGNRGEIRAYFLEKIDKPWNFPRVALDKLVEEIIVGNGREGGGEGDSHRTRGKKRTVADEFNPNDGDGAEGIEKPKETKRPRQIFGY